MALETKKIRKALVLVDFDNLQKNYRDDLQKTEMAIYNALNVINQYSEINIRLYGGWYHFKNESIAARTLAPWVYGFPHVIGRTKINAELVRSLGFEKHDLKKTFRSRTKELSMHIKTGMICKYDDSCDLYRVNKIISEKKCSTSFCSKDITSAFLSNEQKLIDTMISTDLINYSLTTSDDLYLVSSDDDFVPTLRYLSHLGNKINILHTNSNPYRYDSDYTIGNRSNIIEGNL